MNVWLLFAHIDGKWILAKSFSDEALAKQYEASLFGEKTVLIRIDNIDPDSSFQNLEANKM